MIAETETVTLDRATPGFVLVFDREPGVETSIHFDYVECYREMAAFYVEGDTLVSEFWIEDSFKRSGVWAALRAIETGELEAEA